MYIHVRHVNTSIHIMIPPKLKLLSHSHLGFHKYDWIFTPDTAQEQPLGSARTTRHNNHQTRRVRKICLWRLRMIVSTVSHCTTWSTNSNATAIPLIATPVSKFCHLIHNLIESGKYLKKWEGCIRRYRCISFKKKRSLDLFSQSPEDSTHKTAAIEQLT